MPTVTEIRDAIKTRLEAVPDIGVVHAYERYAREVGKFVELFKDPGGLRGWIIRRVSTQETSNAVGRYIVTHRWQIRGYMAIEDAEQSEIVFDERIEAFRDAIRADDSLGGLVATCIVNDVAGVQVEDSGPVLFAGVLCHSARLALFTRHYQ